MTTKKYSKRANQILDVAEKIYLHKGYAASSVQDIIDEVGIAKGTFYHYFKSKEETLEAIVFRRVDKIVKRIESVYRNQELNPMMKLMFAFLTMKADDDTHDHLLDELHQSENVLLHQKQLQEMISRIAPIITDIIYEGVTKHVWTCNYPKEYMQIFLVSSLTLTDQGLFSLSKEEQLPLMIALISLLEKMLDVEKDLFVELYKQNWNT